MFKLKQKRYLFVKALYSNEYFIVIKDEYFIFKVLLLITYAT
jgi:hypothetical protein